MACVIFDHSLQRQHKFESPLSIFFSKSSQKATWLYQNFFFGKRTYNLSARTGFGRSLVYQELPLLHDLLVQKVIGSSMIIIICPLVSLMLDQVAYLKSLGLNVAAIYSSQDSMVLDDIEEGM